MLVDSDLPKIPHHCECHSLPLDEAVELVARVRASAERHAKLALDTVATAIQEAIGGVGLRQCPEWLPSTVPEQIGDYRAANVADWVMYRRAIAAVAESRGWLVHWYDAKKVLQSAAEALRIADFDAHSLKTRKSLGPPWDKDHKVAMAAAIAAAHLPGKPHRAPVARIA